MLHCLNNWHTTSVWYMYTADVTVLQGRAGVRAAAVLTSFSPAGTLTRVTTSSGVSTSGMWQAMASVPAVYLC